MHPSSSRCDGDATGETGEGTTRLDSLIPSQRNEKKEEEHEKTFSRFVQSILPRVILGFNLSTGDIFCCRVSHDEFRE